MEIGLGCTMHYGPGRSFKVWEEYFTHPDAELYFMEINGDCVAKMNIQPRNGRVFIGSQDNTTFLQEVAKAIDSFGGLDVLVDDGGHTMKQQLNTLEIMWPIIRPSGVLIMEDVQTSYRYKDEHGKVFGGTTDNTRRNDHTIARPTTFMGKIVELLDVLNCDYNDEDCDMSLRTVYCYHHACALRRTAPEGDHVDLKNTNGEYIYPSVLSKKRSRPKQH